MGKRNTTHHGCPRNDPKARRLYQVWSNMKARCLDQNHHAYKIYGGRGITVCAEWLHDFSAFRDWAISAGLPSLCRTYSTGLPYFRFFSKAYSCESGSKLRNLWISAVLFPPSFRPFAILSEDSGSSENLLKGGNWVMPPFCRRFSTVLPYVCHPFSVLFPYPKVWLGSNFPYFCHRFSAVFPYRISLYRKRLLGFFLYLLRILSNL